METVWMVMEGQYSDISVAGVFSSKENAEFFITNVPKDEYDHYHAPVEVTLDKHIDKFKLGLLCYSVRMFKDGISDVEKLKFIIREDHDSGRFYPVKDVYSDDEKIPEGKTQEDIVMIIRCWAKDEKHAVKIANEYRVQHIANNTWGKIDE